MADVDEFLAVVLPRLTAADTAIHDGDAKPRLALWSRNDPVTVFGARVSATGWQQVGPMFEWLGAQFSKCESFEYEVIAAGASGDLGYIVGVEHTTASVRDGAPTAYTLRVTTVFRREDGEWKVVHRHADPPPDDDSARAQLDRLSDERPDR